MGERPMYEADGTSVERYELPAGVDPARAAEEIRREVTPEVWKEGMGGIDVGDGFLRVRASGEVQALVRAFLGRGGAK